MVLAVLEAHCGVRLSGHDVYLNVAGGLRIQEPAADVAAAAALVSSLARAPLPADAVYFGEVSLSGAVRPVAQTAARLKEAQKLGFTKGDRPGSGAQRSPRRLLAVRHRHAGQSGRRYRPRRHAAAAPRRPSGRLSPIGARLAGIWAFESAVNNRIMTVPARIVAATELILLSAREDG